MTTSEKIKARRKELGLTLEDVANALGVAKSTVLRYETEAIKNAGSDKIEALARVLNLSPAYLMGWEDEKDLYFYQLLQGVKELDLTPDDVSFLLGVARRVKGAGDPTKK